MAMLVDTAEQAVQVEPYRVDTVEQTVQVEAPMVDTVEQAVQVEPSLVNTVEQAVQVEAPMVDTVEHAGGIHGGREADPALPVLSHAAGHASSSVDMAFKLALELRDEGNKLVQARQYEQAIDRYDAAMELTDSVFLDLKVRELRAAIHLNLSLCFLKTEQWDHAITTATFALQGDKEEPDPHDDILPPVKKAKALFRRATAYCDGLRRFDLAWHDLQRARGYAPDDTDIALMLRQCDAAGLRQFDLREAKAQAGAGAS